jgi:hypothetical protein
MYSYVLSRLIHYIVNTRRLHPTTKIFICKVDLDAAYRRCSLSSKTAMECIAIYAGLLLVALRLTFGGAPGPNIWGVISESITDIGNAILQNKAWDFSSFYDPLSDTIAAPLPLSEVVPFKSAKELSVSLPQNNIGYIDIYIDDNIGIAPDLGDNLTRMKRAITLAIRTLARPLDQMDVIPRKDIVSLKKFQAEGRLEEVKLVLGWIINTRTLTIQLSEDKLRNWNADISRMITSRKAYHKILESSIGRLNHVACILSPMRHYMGRLYQALFRASSLGGWTRLTQTEIDDLQTLQSFLSAANKGLSLNNLVYRKPSKIYRSGASEFGIGGYNIVTGIAWRIELPVSCRLRTSLNSLEFLGCVVSIWIDHFHQVIAQEDCLLSQTDSSSAMGWLRKTNFADKSDEAVQLATARRLAEITIDANCTLYSQWFPGDSNSIADSLSHDFHIDDLLLSNLLVSHFPEQVPFGLTILPVPNEIVSWLTSLLLNQQQKEPWLKEPTKSKFALGIDSSSTSQTLDWSPIPTLITSPNHKESESSVPSLTQYEKADYVMERLIKQSSPSQLDPPWIAYHRPSSWLTDQTQGWTEMEDLRYFYSDNYEGTSP